MSYDCVCDYDAPLFHSIRVVKAKKQHKCYECRALIFPGEKYKYTVGRWDGSGVDTFRTCQNCSDLEQWVRNNVPCVCWTHGNMLEELRDNVRDACDRAPTETAGLMFGFFRRLYHIRKVEKERRNAEISS